MDDEVKFIGGLIAIVIVVCIALMVVSSHFESKTYNKLTGANTTTWDAIWVELRVQDGTAEDK